jgi:hypothetical protein
VARKALSGCQLPFDHFLFGRIKDKLKGLTVASALHLHRAKKQTAQSIDRLILMVICNQWTARANWMERTLNEFPEESRK